MDYNLGVEDAYTDHVTMAINAVDATIIATIKDKRLGAMLQTADIIAVEEPGEDAGDGDEEGLHPDHMAI